MCWVGMGDVSLRRVQADKYKKLGGGLGRIMITNFFLFLVLSGKNLSCIILTKPEVTSS